jgi:branched-subunit amino acid aminotransferase/4-amino-4-deoxychorismate lyase
VLRAILIERGEVLEEVVNLEELAKADEVWRVSSLMGWVSVDLAEQG